MSKGLWFAALTMGVTLSVLAQAASDEAQHPAASSTYPAASGGMAPGSGGSGSGGSGSGGMASGGSSRADAADSSESFGAGSRSALAR